MVDSVRACTRCGTTSDVILTSFDVVEGPLQDTFSKVSLCPHCTRSFTHWMEKKQRQWRSVPERSQPHDAHDPPPRNPELKISDPSREPRSEHGKGPSDDDSGDPPPHSTSESTGRRRRRRRSSSGNSTSSSPSAQVKILKWISHPAFLYVGLFLAAALMMFLLLKMIKPSPVAPEIPG